MSTSSAAAGLLLMMARPKESFDLAAALRELSATPVAKRADVLFEILKAAAYFWIDPRDVRKLNALGAVFNCLPSDDAYVVHLCGRLILHWRALNQWRRAPRKGDKATVNGQRGTVLKVAVKGAERHGKKTYGAYLYVQTTSHGAWAPFVAAKRAHKPVQDLVYVGPKRYCIKDGKLVHIAPRALCRRVAPGIVRFNLADGHVDIESSEVVNVADPPARAHEHAASQVTSAYSPRPGPTSSQPWSTQANAFAHSSEHVESG